MTRRSLSLAFRLTSLFAVASAIVFSIFGWMVYRSMEQRFANEDSDELIIVAEAVSGLLEEFRLTGDKAHLHQRIDDTVVGHHDVAMHLTGPGDMALYTGLGPDLTQIAQEESFAAQISERELEHHHYRVLGRVLQHDGMNESYRLVVAVPIDKHLRFLADFKMTLITMIAAGIVLMSFLGWAAVRKGNEPLHDIITRVRRISANKLNVRIDANDLPRELTELAMSFNEMMERVDGGFQRLQDFNADIAHELRNPIANLMTQTQVGLSKARSAAEYREILYSNIEEYERLAKMVSEMLYLAKAESDPRPQSIESINLAIEIDALFDFYDGWASEVGVKLRRNGGGVFEADRLMIQRALSNLISNAITNARADSEITVSINLSDNRSVRIAVENAGDDIPIEYWPKIFDRFYRIPGNKKNSDQGVGLGLAIVKSIVNAHRGDISVQSANGKTCVTMSLPLAY